MPLPNSKGASYAYFITGDQKAFTRIFKRFFRPLSLYAGRLLNDDAVGKDLAQGVFETLWRKGGKFRKEAAVKSWLYTTMRYACLKHLYYLNREERLLQEREVIYTEEAINVRMENNDTLSAVLNLLEVLPKRCRQVFLLRYLMKKSSGEIASAMGISVSTVKNQLVRADRLLFTARWIKDNTIKKKAK